MLTNRETGANYPVSKNKYFYTGIVSGISILGILTYLIIKNEQSFIHASPPTTPMADSKASTIHMIGIGLMSEYVLVFEVAGILLLMALIGAAFVAGRKTS